MIRHHVPMKLTPGEEIVPLSVGQVIPVYLECDEGQSIEVDMTVLRIYDNGNFDGEVLWAET